MQKLDFNKDGKLVAYTDNGCTDGKSATTEIKGTFEVSADVVKYILSKEYDLPATFHEQQELLQEYKHRLYEANYKLQMLRKAIIDFNRTRRFYERKIKIEDV